MKAKHVLLLLLVAALIVGCCASQPTPPPGDRIYRESIELIGFVPSSDAQRAAFENVLKKYNNSQTEGIFKIWRYQEGNKKPTSEWGNLQDIGCDLEGMIQYVVENGHPRGKMTHTTGITDYAGRIGLTCSTSCGGHDPRVSNAMVEEVNAVIGKHSKKHHH